MNKLRFQTLLIATSVLILYPSVLKGQEIISAGYRLGKIFAHTSKLNYMSDIPANGFNISIGLGNRKSKNWEKYYNYPAYGINYNYNNYNSTKLLGDSHSLTAYFQFSLLPKNWFLETGFIGYSGFGYVTGIRDYEENPDYTALSSNININIQARLFLKVRINPIFIQYSYGLDHFSNGHIKVPNLGLNIVNHSFNLGLISNKKAQLNKINIPEKENIIKDEIWTTYSMGIKEIKQKNNKYMFYSATVNYSKQLTKINKIGVGFDYSFDESSTAYAIETYDFHGKANLNERFGLNAHMEFLIGNLNFYTAYGFYFGDDKYYQSKKYYKIGFKRNFKNVSGFIIIRAIPLFRADVLEFGIGYSFKSFKET